MKCYCIKGWKRKKIKISARYPKIQIGSFKKRAHIESLILSFNNAKLKDREGLSNIKLETFSGTHYEIGLQQGKAIRQLFHKTLERLSDFPEIKIAKPKMMPNALFFSLAKRKATKLLKNDIFKYYPKQAERLKGIAEGAQLDLSWVFFTQSMELLVDFGASMVKIPAYTSIAFAPTRTTTNETLVGRNFDYPNHFLPLNTTCQITPEDSYQTLGCTMAPLPGILEGINEYGLTVTYNAAFSNEKPTFFVPPSILLQEMLETCKNTMQAVNFLLHAKHAGNALLALADSKGDIQAVEYSHNHVAVRKPANGQIINTNHYLTEEMQKYEISKDAVFTEKTGKEWTGKRFHGSSESRFNRLQNLLSSNKIDEKMIASILSDHGLDNQSSNFTVCQHGEYTSTIRSAIFNSTKKVFKVLYGNPCKNNFQTFNL